MTWLVRLAVIRKLASLLGRLIPSAQSVRSISSRFHPGMVSGRFRHWWQGRSKFVRHLLTNILIGMSISLVLVYLHHANMPWLVEFEDAGMDWMMQLHAGATATDRNIPVAWIDIDDDTHRQWGEPLYTPRRQLKEIMAYAARSDARAVVVDIDLSRASADTVNDGILVDFLGHYSGPPLILARTFREPLGGMRAACRELRGSFLENSDAIRKNGNIFWASTLFNRDSDGIIRRWRLWEPACQENGLPVVVPSIQLLVAAIVRGGEDAPAVPVNALEGQLRSYAPSQCLKTIAAENNAKCSSASETVSSVNVGGLVLDASPSHIQQRLVYSIPSDRFASGQIASGDGTMPQFVRHPASPITGSVQAVDSSWLSGRVVIIGSSHADARDTHSTPLGDQAGALILANAISSLIHYGQITPPATWLKLLIEVLLILIMSLAFARFNSFWGMLISGAVVIVVLLPASFLLFKYGVWLDFAIPLVAVQIHQMAAEFEEYRESSTHSDQ